LKGKRILIYGYGNPGRQDDGLGILMTERIEEWIKTTNLQHVDIDSNYQLNIENAAEIAGYDIVIFIDASKEDIDSFKYDEVQPSSKVEFSMHSVSPSFVLNLSRQIHDKAPEVYLLHLKGYEWEFMKEVSEPALRNLEKAEAFLKNKIREYLE
jgi:hydrogenase maturation protease